MVIRIYFAILIVAAAGIFAEKLRSGAPVAGELPPLAEIPTELGDWWSEEFPVSDVEREVLAAEATVNRLYRRSDGATAWLFVAYFSQQQVNSQIHSPRNCLPGSGWRVESVETQDLEIAGERRATSCMQIASERSREGVYYWFQTRTGRVAGEYALKLDLVRNALAGRRTDAAFIRVISAAPEAALDMMELLEEPLDRVLGKAGL